MKCNETGKCGFWARGIWGAVLGAFLLSPQSGTGGTPHRRQVEVKADSLQIKNNHREALFSGNVTFLFDGISLQCERLAVGYGDEGDIKTMVATGGVTVVRDDARATAERAEMTMTSGIVVLTGNPRFERDQNMLTGKVIRVNIRTGEVDVTGASGTFYLPEKTKNE